PSPVGQVCGRLLFAYFFLAKQEKVSSRRATPGQQSKSLSENRQDTQKKQRQTPKPSTANELMLP
ncbi:hypothetical protein, partial [Undibacterium sp.]|uniref:hypothetical protein n=1 Tax=Undibacterium sp. TaxID=1914977 RepID=UPI00374D75E0